MDRERVKQLLALPRLTLGKHAKRGQIVAYYRQRKIRARALMDAIKAP